MLSRRARLACFAAAALALAACTQTAETPAPSGPGGDDGAAATTAPLPRLRPGQARITGTITELVGDDVAGPPIATPFTMTVPATGGRRAHISPVTVGGKPASISWDGGRPLPIQGAGGSLDIGQAHVEVRRDGITWVLDGAARLLKPGKYRAAGSVAVGASGLAQPRDGVDFVASEQTALNTQGGVRVKLPLTAIHLEGPGKFTVSGQLRLETGADDVKNTTKATFGPGEFVVDLNPNNGVITITSLLEGPVTG